MPRQERAREHEVPLVLLARLHISRYVRRSIKSNSAPLREIISGPIFGSLFGEAKAEKNKRSNIFGHEDELKTAPKGVDKTHPCVLLLFSILHPG